MAAPLKPMNAMVAAALGTQGVALIHAADADFVDMVTNGIPVVLDFPIVLTATDTPADLVTDFVLPFSGSVISYQYVTKVVATSGGTADVDIQLELGATAITGAVNTALTQADFSAVGEVKAGGTITALNTFVAGATLSVVCTESAVNFTAGEVLLKVFCRATGV